MDRLRQLALYIIILMLIGCGEESEDNIIPGYISPGQFRPKGMLTDISYQLSDATIDPADRTCSPPDECLAVYANWLSGEVPLDGIAIRNSNTANSKLSMKIYRVKGTGWRISMVYKGVGYTGTAPIGDITVSLCKSTIETLPPYTPPTGDPLDGSGIYLKKATVAFLNDIPLSNGATPPSIITIHPGDQIVALAHNATSSVPCP